MNPIEILDLYYGDDEYILVDGMDEAILGVAQIFHNSPVVAYDFDKVISILQTRDGMTLEEAEEFFEFNIVGAYVGEQTPAFVTVCSTDEKWSNR